MAEIPKLPIGGRAATLRAWVKASKYGGCCRGSRINDNNKATHMDRVVLDSGGGWPACIGRASDKLKGDHVLDRSEEPAKVPGRLFPF